MIFSLIFSSTVNDVRRKLYMVGIYLTVGKQAKRMPDTTVETINFTKAKNALLNMRIFNTKYGLTKYAHPCQKQQNSNGNMYISTFNRV